MYYFLSLIAEIYVRLKLKPEISNNAGKISGPAVILVNHQSNMDWLLTSCVIKRVRVSFVVGRYHFYKPLKSKLFLSLGCIPKDQFYPDIQTVRMIKRRIKDKGVVVIFPSGQSSFSGESTLIPFETAKLLKSLSVPVYFIHIDGAHLAFPKWNMSSIRKNRISVSCGQMLAPGELSALSEAEIFERVNKTLYFDDYEWQRGNKLPSKKSRSAEGLEYVLYKCPLCGEEFGMRAEGSALSCSRCGLLVHMDEHGFLSSRDSRFAFDTPTQWYRWQYGETLKLLRENPQYTFTTPAQLTKLSFSGKTAEKIRGRLSFSNGILELRNGESPEPLFYEDVKLTPILFQHESTLWFELVSEELIHRFRPEPAGAVTKLVILKELCYLAEKRDSARGGDIRAAFEGLISSNTNLK